MADVNATDLTQETKATMDGTEQIIMFDTAEGKRATVAAVGDYVLSKLTTTLNGKSQTVANALSELNSNKANKSIVDDIITDLANSAPYSWHNLQAIILLYAKRDAKLYGVRWDNSSHSCVGTRLYDAVGMTAEPSTDTVRGKNDFEDRSVFYHINVNGYLDDEGEFQVTAIEGVDDNFTRTNDNVWCLYNPQWVKTIITNTTEDLIISDTKFDGAFIEDAAVRANSSAIEKYGKYKPFIPIAKYMDSSMDNSSALTSVSGKAPTNSYISHNTLITKAAKNGKYYSGTSAQDKVHMDNLMDVAFANRSSQAVMYGCFDYYLSYAVATTESSVERVIVTNARAANLMVGSTVSIGDFGSNTDSTRSQSYVHNIAKNVKIKSIADLGNGTSAVYVDNGGTKFTTTSTTHISTMAWHTGSTDGVLGSCGSPISNTNGKFPYKLFGVEFALGWYEVYGNVVLRYDANGIINPYICYDTTKFSSSAPTANYEKINYTVPNTDNAWSYILENGYDINHKSVRLPSVVKGSSTTGYGDSLYSYPATTVNTSREVLLFAALSTGALGGRRCVFGVYGLAVAGWGIGVRLSVTATGVNREVA